MRKPVHVIYTPPKQRGREPRPPAWWRTFWRPTGTIVEYLGVMWELTVVGAGDQVWRQWVRVERYRPFEAHAESQESS